jgi:hypothetical protein
VCAHDESCAIGLPPIFALVMVLGPAPDGDPRELSWRCWSILPLPRSPASQLSGCHLSHGPVDLYRIVVHNTHMSTTRCRESQSACTSDSTKSPAAKNVALAKSFGEALRAALNREPVPESDPCGGSP